MRHIAHRSTSLVFAAIVALAARAASPSRPPPAPEVTVAPAVDRRSPTGTSSPDTSRPSSPSTFARASPDSSSTCPSPKARIVKQGDVLVTIDATSIRSGGRPRRRRCSSRRGRTSSSRSRSSSAPSGSSARRRSRARSSTRARARRRSRRRRFARAEAALRNAQAQSRLDDGSRTDLRPRRSRRDHGGQSRAGRRAVAVAAHDDRLARSDLRLLRHRRAGVSQVRRRRRGARAAKRARCRSGSSNETGFPHEATLDFVDNQRRSHAPARFACAPCCAIRIMQFAPGLFARVRLAGGERRAATMVQDQAIGTDQDRKFVLVLKPDSTVEYRADHRRPRRRRTARRADRAQAGRQRRDQRPASRAAGHEGAPAKIGHHARARAGSDRCTGTRRLNRLHTSLRISLVRFSRFFIDRPVFAVVLSLVVLAAGLISIVGAADQRVS